ncbi:hypothetical protein Tco_0926912 [Tanacetum coccineum]|uniref:Uncharacterized protein n=1 Tax=Tanacetum coccineum TaxID=301880 RepID=A0ABQ5DDW6_9ASTR
MAKPSFIRMEWIVPAGSSGSGGDHEGVSEDIKQFVVALVENKLAIIHQILDTLVGRIENLGGSQQGGNNRGNSLGRMTRIEFSRFNVDDVRDWVFRCEQFSLLDGILDEQKDAFDNLLSMVEINEENVVSFYLGGLPQEIEMGVRMFKPKTLAEVYCLTNLQEASLNVTKRKNRLLYNEGATPGHKCPSQLYSLVVLEEEEEEENLDELEGLEEEQVEKIIRSPQISLNALNGNSLIVDLKTAKINKDSLGHLKFYIWNWPKRGRKGAKCRAKNRERRNGKRHAMNSKEDATWESIEDIQRRFPEFNVLVNPCGHFWWVDLAMCARSTDHPWLIEKHQQSSSSSNGKCKEIPKNEDLIMF